uniref:Uncharacterized protein n=1 Tax=Lutzomyia longipalpis TaxID=7200 RepID=A0A1B0CEN2_LUTLO
MVKGYQAICSGLLIFVLSLCATASEADTSKGGELDISEIPVERFALDLSNRNRRELDRHILRNASAIVHKLILNGNTEYTFPENDVALDDPHLQTFHCIKCNISQIFKENFSKLPHLREVVIQDNPLWTIHEDAFKENKYLHRLDLRRNKLKSFNAEGVLNHMPSLMFIHLCHNDFNFNVKRPFIRTRYMVRFDCIGCNIESISPEALSRIGMLYHMNLSHNRIRRFNLTIPGLMSLDLSHNPLNLTGTELNQPDLESFNCNNCSRSSVINDGIFAKCKSLLTVEMRHCALEEIDDHAFKNNHFLTRLDVDWNNLKRIPRKVIQMSSIEHLCFDYNPIEGTSEDWKLMTVYFARALGAECAVQKNASLMMQLMQTVQPDRVHLIRLHTFQDRIVDLSDRNITFVFPDYFQTHHDNFSVLVMDGNSLFNFQPRVPFTFYEQLEEFQCNGCGIDAIYEETFSYTPHMRRLELKNNKITHIALAVFHHNVALQTLTLNGNPLDILYGAASLSFRNLDVVLPYDLPHRKSQLKIVPSLRNLTCTDCNIFILHENTFKHVPKLEIFNIQGHKLAAFGKELNLSASIDELNLLGNLEEFPFHLFNSSILPKKLCINYTLINATEIAMWGKMEAENFIKLLEGKTCPDYIGVDKEKDKIVNEIKNQLKIIRTEEQRKIEEKRKIEEQRKNEEKRKIEEKCKQIQKSSTTPTTPEENSTRTLNEDREEVEILQGKSDESSNFPTKKNQKLLTMNQSIDVAFLIQFDEYWKIFSPFNWIPIEADFFKFSRLLNGFERDIG